MKIAIAILFLAEVIFIGSFAYIAVANWWNDRKKMKRYGC